MKLYQQFAEKGYHTCIVTTFGLDFDTYETVVLPRLRGAGCRNNIVVADARMLTLALDNRSSLPARAGSHYTVSGVGGRGGVFHPKLLLQIGRDRARLMVGSANMTAAGLAGNLELVTTFRSLEADDAARELIVQAWRYIEAFLSPEQTRQAQWMLARSPWIAHSEVTSDPIRLADGTDGMLLFSGDGEGIGRRFSRLVTGKVRRLIVVSPYWDSSLGAIVDLTRQLEPERTGVLIDPATQAFPAETVARRLPEVEVYARKAFGGTRFMHAKAILALAEDADHILIGSANCTTAALGSSETTEVNAEACVYRRLAPGAALEALGIAALVEEDRRVDVSHLPPMRIADEIPFESLAARSPGAFVLWGDNLRWRPAPGVLDPKRCSVVLLDAAGDDLPAVVERQAPDQSEGLRYLVSGFDTLPTFARVTSPQAGDSALAIVTRLDELTEQVREVGSRRAERLRERLELGTDTEATLELLGIIDELEADARNRPALGQAISTPKPQSEGERSRATSAHRQMSYEEFMAHRQPSREGSRQPASFAGTDLSLVRGVLNRIAGPDVDSSVDDADDATVLAALDLGDEAAAQDGHDPTDFGGEVMPMTKPGRSARAVKAATVQEIDAAISNFTANVRTKHEQGDLSATDLLRLRALLMVVCWAGMPCSPNVGRTSDLQVLPMSGGEPTWWRSVGRLLYALFRRNDSGLGLSLTDEHDRLPPDVLECWATCYWCLQVCLAAPVAASAGEQIRQRIQPLAERVYRLTMLSKDELCGGVVRETMDRLSHRLAERLGVDSEMVAAGHESMAMRYRAS